MERAVKEVAGRSSTWMQSSPARDVMVPTPRNKIEVSESFNNFKLKFQLELEEKTSTLKLPPSVQQPLPRARTGGAGKRGGSVFLGDEQPITPVSRAAVFAR
jgi:hypothetical protein